ncbi:hypothetical protein E1B28_002312 [Marasmius oreades]|uniref:Carboxymuconolactone decarboxylase-like domain-containing protein n=1 Tax=Marasmius oreades TaxID=181124 RepID=A0A9P7RME2_9AGAR|nr:uncharacterized protein E1B28_002312 [Marasmius oreades]KAG7086351.1 hypothetical protein E1B28_002312 [Marasmius oreades]
MSKVDLVNAAFLDKLQSMYPSDPSDKVWKNPWYIVACVAFNASNEPEAIPLVFQHALKSTTSHEERLTLARKVRDALYNSAVNSGFAKGINSLVALSKVMPEELKDKKMFRDRTAPLSDFEETGRNFFRQLYGETADSVQTLLDDIYPDLGWFCNTIGYGVVYGCHEILTPLEVSYTLVGTLIANDTPRQINWHLKGARRLGATVEEVKAVREMAMEVASLCGVKWKEGVPELQEDGV